DPLQDARGVWLLERAVEEFRSTVDAAPRNIPGGQCEVMELVQDPLPHFGLHRSEHGDLPGDAFDFFFREMSEDPRDGFLAEDKRENRGLAHAGDGDLNRHDWCSVLLFG